MRQHILTARAFFARGLIANIFLGLYIRARIVSGSTAWSEPKDIRWGTGPVGSAGHKALVVLADLLNKEMPEIPHHRVADAGRR